MHDSSKVVSASIGRDADEANGKSTAGREGERTLLLKWSEGY